MEVSDSKSSQDTKLCGGDGSKSRLESATGNNNQPLSEENLCHGAMNTVPETREGSNQPVASPKIKENADNIDKIGIFKALAIKLKKELVKSREDLKQLKEESEAKSNALLEEVKLLKDKIEVDKQSYTATITALEVKVRDLKEQLASSEFDLCSLQNEFEDYKARASKMMQQFNLGQPNPCKTFEEDRYRNLRQLNDEQHKRIEQLESIVSDTLNQNQVLENETKILRERLNSAREELAQNESLDSKCENLLRENENLKLALKQFRVKLREPSHPISLLQNCDESINSHDAKDLIGVTNHSANSYEDSTVNSAANKLEGLTCVEPSSETRAEESLRRLSPSASVKDGSQTNSSSSFDGSVSGYVHIKPNTFEIISRSTVLEDAQNQIDNLTKAYLDSESTNSLLTEQIIALKEEIKRMHRSYERIELAENLEYLKNVIFKFISLDSGQAEQRQRLIPVLTTVLKLSPEETAKLNMLSTPEKTMTSSFFKL